MKNILYIIIFSFIAIHTYGQCVIACKSQIEISTIQWTCEAEYLIADGIDYLDGDYTGCNLDLIVDLNGKTSGETVMLSQGDYTITITDNNSGNTCFLILTVVDDVPPVVVVISLSTAVIDNGEVELWAIDFDSGSYDNCSGVRFTFTDVSPELDPNFDLGSNSSSRIFNCSDLLMADVNGLIDVFIYTWDDLGNSNYAVLSLSLVDPEDFCSLPTPHVINNNNQCEGYELLLNNNPMPQDFSQCAYGIDPNDVQTGNNTITIATDPDASFSAATTLDLVIMQKGIINGFDNNFQVVAADIDRDGTLSTDDLLTFRQLILNMLPIEDYAFHHLFPSDYEFAPDFDLYDFENDFTAIDVDESVLQDHFYVKVITLGNVNEAEFNSNDDTDNRSTQKLRFTDQYLEAGETYSKAFTFNSNLDLRALTLGLQLNGLEVTDIRSETADPIFMSAIFDDQINLSVLSNINNTESSLAFEISFKANKAGLLSNMISIDKDKNEFIDGALSRTEVDLEVEGILDIKNESIATIQIFPNPSNGVVNIVFDTNENEKLIFVYNLEGQLLNKISTEESRIILNKNDYSSDVLLINTISQNASHSEKVIFH